MNDKVYTIYQNSGMVITVTGIDYIIDVENRIFKVIENGMKTRFLALLDKIDSVTIEYIYDE